MNRRSPLVLNRRSPRVLNRYSPRVLNAAFLLAVLGLTFALHRSALAVFFGQDDLLFLQRAAGLVEWSHGLRRLLSVRIFFTTAWRLFGDQAVLYHVIILSLHAVNAWLVARLGMRLGLSARGAAAAGLAFAAAPVAFTCLHWISGVQEVLSATFALLSVLCFLRGRLIWDGVGAVAFVASLLSKEAGFLLMPALAVVLPMSRRRRIVIAASGLVIGFALLAGAGALTKRPHGDPYESAYGLNVLENLLTYLAWLVRPWDYFPDRAPEFQPALWRWGLAIPALYGLVLWRVARWRAALLKAGLLFLVLLLPVLPLVRHSYLYYLYVPLIPIWLLMAAGLERSSRSWAVFLLPLCLLGIASWQSSERRGETLRGMIRSDSILRYPEMVKSAVQDLRAAKGPMRGDILILTPFLGEVVDLAKDIRASADARRMRFLPVAKALHDGADLKLFFPELTSVRFVQDFDGREDVDWEDKELFWTYGQARMGYLGRGEAGRFELSRLFFQQKDFVRARREVELLLARHPDDPDRLFDLGTLAIVEGKTDEVERVRLRLEELARAERSPGAATQALREYQQAMAAKRPGGGKAP